ncbi:MAG: hypothetical protein JW801_18745 [Bacteroidales bacterium]|nr:hypothetical protein [Bacteroidales bacterium]
MRNFIFFIGKKIHLWFSGDDRKHHFEHRFINSVSLAIAATGLSGFIFNLILDLGKIETYLTLLTTLIYLLVFILSRVFSLVQVSKWLALVAAYFLLSSLWLYSAGSYGPIPYTYFLLILSIVLITDKWLRWLLLVLVGLNIIILFYYEGAHPGILLPYPTEYERRVDMVSSLILYFWVGAIIMGYAKQNYIQEKRKAEKSDRLKSAFLANMSHEIRTPMNAIMGFTGLLRRSGISQEKREHYHDTVEESVDYLLRLIDDILDISRIEADELRILPRSVHLDKFMMNLELTFRQIVPQEKRSKLELLYDRQEQDIMIETDTARLEQILSNLVSNALKFTEKGYVKFGYKIQKEWVQFHILDTGIGIDEEDKDRVFDRFVKIDSSNCEVLHRGTGIGLSIAKKLIEMLGGNIWLESIPNQGSAFYFTLPIKLSEQFKEKYAKF